MEPGETIVLPPALPCANCATPLTGPFCAQCGQHVADYHRSVWRFVTDFLDNTFCWDNKLLRTLGPLFRQPGGLTVEFMAGRRVRYVHPLRLFLFTSAVCLALLHFGSNTFDTDHGKHPSKAAARRQGKKSGADAPAPTPAAAVGNDAAQAGETPEELPPEAAAVLAKLSAAGVPVVAPGLPSTAAADAASPTPTGSPPDRAAVKAEVRAALTGKLGDERAAQVTELGDRISEAVEKKVESEGMGGFTRQISEGVRQRLSWVALGMLPIFALMLRGLYWRADSYYFLHLVFSLHYHTFLLMFWTAYSWLRVGLDRTFLHSVVFLCLLGVPVYLFLALRRVYGDSARRTWLKVGVLGAMHLLAIVAALGAIGGLAFFSAVR